MMYAVMANISDNHYFFNFLQIFSLRVGKMKYICLN